MREDFHVFEMAAHTMTEGFCHLKTLRVESGMSAENFTRALLFCQLQIASTVNNFSSEKMTSLVSVPAFNLLRRIFARTSLVPVPARDRPGPRPQLGMPIFAPDRPQPGLGKIKQTINLTILDF